jgi:DNA-binding response OmpR family regulator
LVVDDEPLMLGMFGDCVVHAGYAPLLAGTKQAAIDQLDTQLLAAIVDVWLPDGSGFDVVQSMKTTQPELPVIMVTGLNDAYVANRAQLLGAEYACKPDVRANVREFLRRCAPPNSVNAVLAEFALRCRITPAERRLVAAALEDASHDSLSDQLGVSVNTIKKQIASVLEKARANTLEEVVAPLRARVLRW